MGRAVERLHVILSLLGTALYVHVGVPPPPQPVTVQVGLPEINSYPE
jgi:hypothetical protein